MRFSCVGSLLLTHGTNKGLIELLTCMQGADGKRQTRLTCAAAMGNPKNGTRFDWSVDWQRNREPFTTLKQQTTLFDPRRYLPSSRKKRHCLFLCGRLISTILYACISPNAYIYIYIYIYIYMYIYIYIYIIYEHSCEVISRPAIPLKL